MNNKFEFTPGAIDSPKDELRTAWTLASVGASTVYPKARFIEAVLKLRILMQGQIGCCVGCTGEEVVRLIVMVLFGTQDELSFRLVYAICKAIEGKKVTFSDGTVIDATMFPATAGANDGTYPALAAIVIRKIGVSLAKYCPNDVSLSADTFCYGRKLENIPKEAIEDAKNRRSGADFAVPVTLDGIKQAINYAADNNGGVMILRRIGDTYWKNKQGVNDWSKKGLLPIRVTKKTPGGHEELLYGYDEEPGTGRVRLYWLNHWSDSWCSTSGNVNGKAPTDHDGGRAWEYADEWLPYIGEIRVVVASVPTVDTFKYKFTKFLQKGNKGPDVVALQHALKLENCFPAEQSFTGYFGDITFSAVVKFQEKYTAEILTPVNLTHGTGIVGVNTLKKLNALYGNY